MEADAGIRQDFERFADAVLPHTRRLTAAELAAEAGVDLDLARRLRRAMGLPDVDADEPVFYDEDLDALRRARVLVAEEGVGEAEILHLTRTLGLASARMADAVVGFWAERAAEAPAAAASRTVGESPAAGESPATDAPQAVDGAANLLTAERIDLLEDVVGYLLRRHLLDSLTRRMGSTEGFESSNVVAVGFADLVGFTSLSEQLSDRETAELIERFEGLATDQIVGGGGRVIKMIGDEVMFASEPGRVAEIALGLSETFDSPDLPAVRVGVAAGAVVSQSGDLYGPVVNLASRATMAARPGTVLVSADLAEMIREDDRYSVATLRPHRLKGIGFVSLAALRRAAPGPKERRSTRRAG